MLWNTRPMLIICQGPSWSWFYGSTCRIYNYRFNQCLSPLTLWVRTLLSQGELDTTLCDKVCQWLATGWWLSWGTLVTNKTNRHDITEMLLKVALNTIYQTILLYPLHNNVNIKITLVFSGMAISICDSWFLSYARFWFEEFKQWILD